MTLYRFDLEFSGACDFRCVYCPWGHRTDEAGDGIENPFNRKAGIMSDETFGACLTATQEHGEHVDVAFLGEPLLHPKFAEWSWWLAKRPRRYTMSVNTNGSHMTRDLFEALGRFDQVRISLDSDDAETWETMCPGGPVLDLGGKRGGGRHETLVAKVEAWLGWPHHAPTRLVFVRTERNREEEGRFAARWRPLLGPRDEVVAKAALSYGGSVPETPGAAWPKRPCRTYAERRIVVAWDGRVTPCQLDANVEMHVGDIRDGLPAIVASEKYQEIIGTMQRREGMCSGCMDAQNHGQRKTCA